MCVLHGFAAITTPGFSDNITQRLRRMAMDSGPLGFEISRYFKNDINSVSMLHWNTL